MALALSGDDYRVDIGSTPLGQDLNTVVGGEMVAETHQLPVADLHR
jgi:hypothetical protein